MKNTKTITLLLIIFLAFTACSPNSTDTSVNNEFSTDDADRAEIAESYYEALGERDFGDDTFTILDANSAPHLFVNSPDEEGMTGEPINDALYMRDKLIEEKYSVNMKYVKIIGGDGGSVLEKSIRAGENSYDLLVSPAMGASLETISTRNVLYNLIDAPYLSLQSPWWSKMIYENMQLNSKLYYIGGDIFLPSYSLAPAAMMFNKKLLQDYGINENLYNLVFDGKWTIDAFERFTKGVNTDLNQDGVMHADDDFFGFICIMDRTNTVLWLAGLGVKFSTVTDNTINIDLASSENIDKIDRLTNVMQAVKYANIQDVIDKAFKENRAMFLSHALETPRMYLRDMEDDYGILPMPKYEERQETYVSALNPWVSGFVAIPQNADIEKSAFLMEAMGYAGYEMLRPVVYDITLKAKGARDEESERIIDIIIETSYLDLNNVYNFGGSTDILNDAVMNKKPFVSAYEQKEAAIQRDIDKFVEAMSEND